MNKIKRKDYYFFSEIRKELNGKQACSKDTCPEPKETPSSGGSRSSPVVSAFSVSEPMSFTPYQSDYKLQNYGKVHFNEGNDFSSETGIFRCSKPGVYYFTASLVKKRALEKKFEKVDFVHCKIFKNTNEVLDILVDPTDDDTDIGSAAVSNSVILRLASSDKVYLGDCDDPLVSLESWSSFSGFLLYPDE